MASRAEILGAGSTLDAVDGPFSEDELHDGLAPTGERDGGAEVVGVASAADQGRVANAAGGPCTGFHPSKSRRRDFRRNRGRRLRRCRESQIRGSRAAIQGGFGGFVVASEG